MSILNRKAKIRPYHSGIVLAGGAARGAYQLGVWTILRKHKFAFDGFAGTSVGALNAALMAQNDYDLACELWETMTLSDVLVLPKDMTPADMTKMTLKTFRGLYQEVLRRGGLDSSPLLKLISRYTREDYLRKRNIDLGIVTFAVPQMKPIKLFLDEMEPGKLPEYLYASASFPLFKAAKIDNQHFTDGGMNDNVPSSMMQNRGYRDLVIIDISSMGIVHKPEHENMRMMYIKNSKPLPHIMDFHPKSYRQSRLMGELDARRILGELEGKNYYIDFSSDSNNLLDKLQRDQASYNRESLPEGIRNYKNKAVGILEATGRCYGIDSGRCYTVDEMTEAIRNKDRAIMAQISESAAKEDPVTTGTIGNILMTILREKMGNTELLQDNPPILWILAAGKLLPKYSQRIEQALRMLYPELVIAEKFRAQFL